MHLTPGRYAIFEGGYVASYLHKSDRSLPPTVGVLVQLDEPGELPPRPGAAEVAEARLASIHAARAPSTWPASSSPRPRSTTMLA